MSQPKATSTAVPKAYSSALEQGCDDNIARGTEAAVCTRRTRHEPVGYEHLFAREA